MAKISADEYFLWVGYSIVFSIVAESLRLLNQDLRVNQAMLQYISLVRAVWSWLGSSENTTKFFMKIGHLNNIQTMQSWITIPRLTQSKSAFIDWGCFIIPE